ncbi:MAG: glutaredoxin family protein [Methylococcales bacterium]|nr:glutaredoxin family protein [Methylococcales bacterium]
MQLILFGTSACHLCEQANEILGGVLIHFPKIRLELIDIAEQIQWQARYAVKIPVLYDVDTQSELNWPFNETGVTTFINKLNHD